MDNLARQVNYGVSPPQGGYDLEFYNSPADTTASRGCWKEPQNGGGPLNNNNVSPGHELESGNFAISVSTGESELFIDELIELADESSVSGSCNSSAMSTPSPVLLVQSTNNSKFKNEAVRPLSSAATTTLPFHSRLHEALTQPRLPTQPVKCHRCGNELTSRCLMQTCADDARCRQCGSELTAKCILAVCTVQPKLEPFGHQPPPRKRVHHYSTPS